MVHQHTVYRAIHWLKFLCQQKHRGAWCMVHGAWCTQSRCVMRNPAKREAWPEGPAERSHEINIQGKYRDHEQKTMESYLILRYYRNSQSKHIRTQEMRLPFFQIKNQITYTPTLKYFACTKLFALTHTQIYCLMSLHPPQHLAPSPTNSHIPTTKCRFQYNFDVFNVHNDLQLFINFFNYLKTFNSS